MSTNGEGTLPERVRQHALVQCDDKGYYLRRIALFNIR